MGVKKYHFAYHSVISSTPIVISSGARNFSLPFNTQIFPVRVYSVHQLIFLLSSPFFYFFFSGSLSPTVISAGENHSPAYRLSPYQLKK